MIYVLGGAPRVGKTTAARRFAARTGVSVFSIDYLKMGLVRGMPDYGVDVYDDRGTATKLWPILRGMIHTYAEEQESILMEGYYLLPEYVAELHRDLNGHIRSCFVGFCDMPTMQKVAELRQYSPRGWSSPQDDEAIEMAEHLKSVSRQIREGCAQHGLQYFDNVANHDDTLDQIATWLAESP